MIVYRCRLACSVACIIVGVSFNYNVITLLNSCLNESVLRIIFIEGSFACSNYTDKVSCVVILISGIILTDKLIKLIVNIRCFNAVYIFQGAVAYAIVSIGVRGLGFTLGYGFTCQTIEFIIGIFNCSVDFLNFYTLARSAKCIDIFYHNIAVAVNSFFTNKMIGKL